MAKGQCPPISEELIQYLSEQFPDRCPNLIDTDREIWVAVGARSVVRHLRRHFEEQNGLHHILRT